jgi:hypothetical protein
MGAHLGAHWAVVVLVVGLIPATAGADSYRMPTLTATNPAPGVVELAWTGLGSTSSGGRHYADGQADDEADEEHLHCLL